MPFILGALYVLIFILAIGAVIGISWAICCGFVYLICLCFGWTFDPLIATGIFLIIVFIKIFLFPSKGKSND